MLTSDHISGETPAEVSNGPTRNADCNWTEFKSNYLEQYGVDRDGNPIPDFTLLVEDRILNSEFVRIVTESPELIKKLGSARRMLDCCVGGCFRTSLLIAPFADPEKAIIELADLEGPQLDLTRRGLEYGLAGWKHHADNIAQYDKKGYWQNAIGVVRKCGVVVPRNIFELPRNKYSVTTTGFGPESLTAELKEWELGVNSLINATELNGFFAMHYMNGSNGWRGFPAVPIEKNDVERVLAGKVRILGHAFAPASGAARKKTDPTHYNGMGLVIGIVESHS